MMYKQHGVTHFALALTTLKPSNTPTSKKVYSFVKQCELTLIVRKQTCKKVLKKVNFSAMFHEIEKKIAYTYPKAIFMLQNLVFQKTNKQNKSTLTLDKKIMHASTPKKIEKLDDIY